MIVRERLQTTGCLTSLRRTDAFVAPDAVLVGSHDLLRLNHRTIGYEQGMHSEQSNQPISPGSPNVAQDAQTLTEALTTIEAAGYRAQFRASDDAQVQCFTCRSLTHASSIRVETLSRLEGVSDPADMLAVVGITCPLCGAKGTLILGYGPDSTAEDSLVLQAMGDGRIGTGVPGTHI